MLSGFSIFHTTFGTEAVLFFLLTPIPSPLCLYLCLHTHTDANTLLLPTLPTCLYPAHGTGTPFLFHLLCHILCPNVTHLCTPPRDIPLQQPGIHFVVLLLFLFYLFVCTYLLSLDCDTPRPETMLVYIMVSVPAGCDLCIKQHKLPPMGNTYITVKEIPKEEPPWPAEQS